MSKITTSLLANTITSSTTFKIGTTLVGMVIGKVIGQWIGDKLTEGKQQNQQ